MLRPVVFATDLPYFLLSFSERGILQQGVTEFLILFFFYNIVLQRCKLTYILQYTPASECSFVFSKIQSAGTLRVFSCNPLAFTVE